VKQALVFCSASALLVAAILAVTWPLLDTGAWSWLARSAAVAFAVQFSLHLLFARWRTRTDRMLAGIVGGAAVRFAVVLAGVVWVVVREPEHPVAFLLGLVGFLFGMLLIEAALENMKRFRPDLGAHQAAPAQPLVGK